MGHRQHPCGRVVVVVVDRRWPGPVCFHSPGSSELQVLVGERERAICEICALTGRVPGWGGGLGSPSATPWWRKFFSISPELGLAGFNIEGPANTW